MTAGGGSYTGKEGEPSWCDFILGDKGFLPVACSIQVALAAVAQWIEPEPANQRVAGSIPSQGTGLGCGPCPQLGAHERQPHIDVSLPLFLPPVPPL